ncbi:dihydropteroate synthase [Paracnuella aquatica]|uniref:dihydropteroate synthase n=1 Tax=Paracnuella aquatica TaxID=2268757 RepID=UPI000DEEB446|nr:dihydropteroate synthase [Paracnuella aquatica]RPD51396.1 dihydropteroate synthase [Paracnuella aquatica]
MNSINCRGRLLHFDEPRIMGILNTTPDSFFSGSRTASLEAVVERAGKLLEQGAAIIDIGGQSTRPNAERVAAEEEAERVFPAIEAVAHHFPEAIISIDTFYATVALGAVERGAAIVNDVSAGSLDAALLPTVAKLGVPYVLMHMQGNPQNMQQAPQYNNVVLDVFDYLNFRIAELRAMGIKDIIVDPGFGFGKTAAHNFELMSRLEYFQQLEHPLLVGISRKGMVYRTLGISADEALNGTTVLHTVSLMKGAQILRVHDVAEAVQAVRLVAALNGEL